MPIDPLRMNQLRGKMLAQLEAALAKKGSRPRGGNG
jgi:hypothetical protein